MQAGTHVGSRRFLELVLIIIASSCLTGCAWNRQRINVPDFHSRITGLVKGTTTADQLTEMVGSPPNSILNSPDGGKVHVYFFGDTKSHAFSLIFLTISKTNVGLDSGIFYFDPNGVLTDYSVGTNSKDLEWQWWAWGDDDA